MSSEFKVTVERVERETLTIWAAGGDAAKVIAETERPGFRVVTTVPTGREHPPTAPQDWMDRDG